MKTWEKIALGFCVVFLLFLAFEVGNTHGQRKQQYITVTSQGTYRAYTMKAAFDTHTGEPVYWIVGGKMTDGALMKGGKVYKGIVEPDTISLILIPRKMVVNLSADNLPDPSKNEYWRLEVSDGKAIAINDDACRTFVA